MDIVKIVLENLILCSFEVFQALCKLIDYFLGNARSLPAEQVNISWNKIARDKVIEIYLDVSLQEKYLSY